MKSNFKPKIIVGLGNPGGEYKKTYHNAGFLFIDYLVKNSQILNSLKSDVYMNLSGSFVKKALKKYKVKSEEILIVHDDSDIELGGYKLSFGRGSAGHNGVESIIKSLGTKNFWRLRIGVGTKQQTANSKQQTAKKVKAMDLVLKKITKKDMDMIKETFRDAIENIF
ncbi:peptidyl-tRNA hydrolase [Candidatus Wolfebacteria bacterium]|nr:peptidyl-tRNA hydrolase [Candidatus Wolfebacteria bacterium]